MASLWLFHINVSTKYSGSRSNYRTETRYPTEEAQTDVKQKEAMAHNSIGGTM